MARPNGSAVDVDGGQTNGRNSSFSSADHPCLWVLHGAIDLDVPVVKLDPELSFQHDQ
jgi:hypothetical protein